MKIKEIALTVIYAIVVIMMTLIYCNIKNGLNVDYKVQINKINDSLSITETDIPE